MSQQHRRRDRLARVYAHAPDRRRVAQARSSERPNLGPVAYAAHPGRGILGWSAAARAALLWIVTATAFSFAFARLRLETGSVWPAITLHSAWNAVIQAAFDPASAGARAELWIGESGILVAITMIVAAATLCCGRWTIRTAPLPLRGCVEHISNNKPPPG